MLTWVAFDGYPVDMGDIKELEIRLGHGRVADSRSGRRRQGRNLSGIKQKRSSVPSTSRMTAWSDADSTWRWVERLHPWFEVTHGVPLR